MSVSDGVRRHGDRDMADIALATSRGVVCSVYWRREQLGVWRVIGRAASVGAGRMKCVRLTSDSAGGYDCMVFGYARNVGRAGRLAQLVEHRLYTPAVTGSSPVPPTSLRCLAWMHRQASFGEASQKTTTRGCSTTALVGPMGAALGGRVDTLRTQRRSLTRNPEALWSALANPIRRAACRTAAARPRTCSSLGAGTVGWTRPGKPAAAKVDDKMGTNSLASFRSGRGPPAAPLEAQGASYVRRSRTPTGRHCKGC